MSKNMTEQSESHYVARKAELDTRRAQRFVMSLEALTSPDSTKFPIRGITGIESLARRMVYSRHMRTGLPVLLFWGPHPERVHANGRDIRTLEIIERLFTEKLGVQAKLQVILADAHGDFNSRNNPQYLEEVRKMIHQNGGTSYYLWDLYRQYGLSFDRSKNNLNNQVDSRLLEMLAASSERIEGRGDPHAYAHMRLQEANMIRNLVGPLGVFAVVGDPVYSSLFPHDVPTIFIRAAAKSGNRYLNLAPWITGNG